MQMHTYAIVAVVLSLAYGVVIGQNDAANSFGDWIGARVGKVSTGLLLCGIFALAGAFLEGGKVVKTIGGGIVPKEFLTEQIAVVGMVASIVWVFIASRFGLPISTTHAAVGAIGGIGAGLILFGVMPGERFQLSVVRNICVSWLLTPTSSALIAFLLAKALLPFLHSVVPARALATAAKALLTLSSSYVAYTWGANDVANAVALLAGSDILSPRLACTLGGAAIALGAVLLGRKVAETVGFGISSLTPTAGFVADIATAVVIHTFTRFHIPVSTTHSLVGAIFGVGVARGVSMVNFRIVREIVIAWTLTPVVTFCVTFLVYGVFRIVLKI